MLNEQIKNDQTGGIASLFVAMVELGDATTKFTVNQLQNGVDVFMDPGRAIDRMRRSINNFSDAMYRSAKPERIEFQQMDTDEDLTGHHHAGSRENNSSHRRTASEEHETHAGASHSTAHGEHAAHAKK